MLRALAISALAVLALTACQETETSLDQHAPSAPVEEAKIAPPPAQAELTNARGFMTANPVAPNSAKKRTPEGRARDADGRPYGYDLLGKPLPDFQGTLSTGEMFASDELDRWTVIRVWGVWCHDSRNDAPYAAALQTALAQDPGVDFITIHVPQDEAHLAADQMFRKYGSLQRYLKTENLSFPTLTDTDASLRQALEIEWTPSYLVVSPDGIVRGFRTDLSVAGDEPVKDFVKDIAKLRAMVGNAPRIETLMHIGPAGASYLRGPTPFALTAMEDAFPGLTIATQPEPAFEISDDSKGILFSIQPDWTLGHVGFVSTTNGAIAGPHGERVGIYTHADLSPADAARCERETKATQSRLICSTSASDGRFSLIFGDDAAKTLVEMRYMPPAPK